MIDNYLKISYRRVRGPRDVESRLEKGDIESQVFPFDSTSLTSFNQAWSDSLDYYKHPDEHVRSMSLFKAVLPYDFPVIGEGL